VKKEFGRNKTANCLECLIMQFKYLHFSMADVGYVYVFNFNPYKPLVRRCMAIFSFHAKQL